MSKILPIGLKLLHKDAQVPTYAHIGDSGFDLRSVESIRILPGHMAIVSTGLALEIREGYEVQIRPRSGISTKGITVNNSPGTIDSSYRGEIKIILINHSRDIFNIAVGDRIAQGVLAEVPKADFQVVQEFSETVRGDGGLGSSGKN